MSRTDDNYDNNDSGCSVSGCGCVFVILALALALNIPAILDFILRINGR